MTGPTGPTEAAGGRSAQAAWSRLTRELAARGHPRPALAAAVLVCRGGLLLDVDGFARLLRVDVPLVRGLEAGTRSPDAVPSRLVRLAPDLDWRAAGVNAGGGADPPFAIPPPAGTAQGERRVQAPLPEGENRPMDEMRFENRMSEADALMWTIERDPLLRSTITSVALLDRAPDRKRLLDAMERCTRLVPRLRQRVVANPFSIAPPRWEVDPNFDRSFHVRFLRTGGTGHLRDVLDMAAPIAMQGFDRARPLWEVTVVEGLEDERAAVILKLHHSITDGVGGVKLAMHLFELDREGADRRPMPAAPEVHVLNQLQRVVDAVQHEQRRSGGVIRRSAGTVAGGVASAMSDVRGTAQRFGETVSSVSRLLAPATQPLSDVMTGRSLSVRFDTLRLPLEELKAAGRRSGGKLNDAFVAGVAGGLRQYHLRHGSSVDALRMTMPINIRNEGTSDLAGNQFAPARFAVPIGIDDPVERMQRIRQLVTAARGEPGLALVGPLSSVLFRLPATVSTGLFGSMLKGVDFVTTNVPGVPIPVFLAGAKLEAQFPFGPMSGSATNIALLSYLDEAQIGVNSDPAAIPDGDAFIECIDDGFREVLKSA